MKTKTILIFVILFSLMIMASCEKIAGNKALRWYYKTGDYVDENGNYPLAETGRDMAISGNKLIAIRGSYVICFDKLNGDILWSYNTERGLQRTPIIANNKIFIVSERNSFELIVLDLNGNVPDDYIPSTYDYLEGNKLLAIPAFSNDKIYVQLLQITPYFSNIVATIDVNTYEVEEFAEIGFLLEGRLVVNDNLLYVPYSRGYGKHPGIRAYDITTKELIWETNFDEGLDILGNNPILYKDKLYIGRAYKTWVLDPLTGNILKEYWGPGSKGYSVADNILLQTAALRAIDLTTDEELWDNNTPSYLSGGSVYHNGVFYLLYYGFNAYDIYTGEDLVGHSFDESPYVWENDSSFDSLPIADGDTIYCNGLEGIYAFKAVK